MKVDHVRQVAFAVKDIDSAKRFYGQTLGLEHLFDAGPHLAFFQMGKTRLMLSQVTEGEAEQDTTIYCLVQDLEDAHRQAVIDGAENAGDPHLVAELADHDLWIGFVKDPDGRVIGLMEERRR